MLVYGGGSCLAPPSPLLSSPVPSLFWWSWGFAVSQSHNTAKNLCVCQWVGASYVLSLGLSFLYRWLRRKVGKLSQPYR